MCHKLDKKCNVFCEKVKIYYEVVEPIVGNLSVLVEFDDEIEVSEA